MPRHSATDRRLFVYGTLAPGESNAGQLVGLRGEWSRATVRGRRLGPGWLAGFDYPGLVLDEAGDEVVGLLFESAELPAAWLALDRFEGEHYRRVVARVRRESGEFVDAHVYECADRPGRGRSLLDG